MDNREKIKAVKGLLLIDREKLEKQISDIQDSLYQIDSNLSDLDDLDEDADEDYIEDLRKW